MLIIKEAIIMSKETTELTESEKATLSTTVEVPMGFEDEEAGDMIIPRVKCVQTLSPEKKAKQADEGDIINSLTLEKYNGKKFIPVFKFNNNIDWKPRSEGGGINCIARDGKVGQLIDGTTKLCTACKRCEFDNTKTGKDAIPKCTKYINYFGFFEGEKIPVIASFAKTNYNEGRKLYSLAKVTMQNMWNYGYTFKSRLMSKGGNDWYIIVPEAAGATTDEDRQFAANLYQQFRNMNDIKFDMEDGTTSEAGSSVDTNATEF
jgi:hypothetical protein